MPKEMERKLKATAKKRGYGKERSNTYVYGAMRNTGWTPNHNWDGTTGEIDYTPETIINHKD